MQCDGQVCTFSNQNYNGVQAAGNQIKIDFLMGFASKPNLQGLTVNGLDVCEGESGTTPETTTGNPETTPENPETTTTENPETTTDNPQTTTTENGSTTPNDGSCVPDNYGFGEAIDKSLLFYEAQRYFSQFSNHF